MARTTSTPPPSVPEKIVDIDVSEEMRGSFLVQRLDYSGDFNGERTYSLQLESSGAVVPA